MFAFILLIGYDPTFTVENKCPPSFTVVNKCPAVKAKPVKVTNGLNCRAGFCTAQGGVGCAAMGQTCPNSAGGQCVCGPKAAPTRPAPVVSGSIQYCPPGGT
jgi:hypothetical protein